MALAALLIACWSLPVYGADTDAGFPSEAEITAQHDAAARQLLNTAVKLPPAEQTSAELKRILDQPEFQEQGDAGPSETWVDRLLNWLENLFGRLGFARGGPGVYIAMAAVLILTFILVRLAWGAMARRAVRAAQFTGQELGDLTPVELERRAEAAAAAGDYRLAIRYRFHSLIALLNLPASVVLTNRHLQRQVAENWPKVLPAFRELAGSFEDAWYGGITCGGDQYARASLLVTQARQSLEETTND